MPQKVTGPDGKQYYDGGAAGLIPAENIEGPAAAPETYMQKGKRILGNMAPEIAAGAAGVLGPETGGLSFALPPLAAGVTEAGKEYLENGSIDPKTVVERAGLNAIPMLGGKAYSAIKGAAGAGRAAIDTAIGTAKGGATGGVLASLRSLLGGTGADAAAGDGAEILGDKLISPEGLAQVKNHIVQLAGTGKAYGDPEFDAASSLYEQIQQALTKRSMPDLARDVGLPISTAAERASAAAKAGGKSVYKALQSLLAAGTSTGGAERGQ